MKSKLRSKRPWGIATYCYSQCLQLEGSRGWFGVWSSSANPWASMECSPPPSPAGGPRCELNGALFMNRLTHTHTHKHTHTHTIHCRGGAWLYIATHRRSLPCFLLPSDSFLPPFPSSGGTRLFSLLFPFLTAHWFHILTRPEKTQTIYPTLHSRTIKFPRWDLTIH